MTWNPGPAWLFCPADRPDRFAKAYGVADVVILDLEDAVAPGRKAAAREALADAELIPDRTIVRINPAGGGDHRLDVEVIHRLDLPRVMLAKAQDPDDTALLTDHQVIALIESPRGLAGIDAIASVESVIAVMWGAEDLVVALGGTSGRAPGGALRSVAEHVRVRTLLAARAAGILAVDGVWLDLTDPDGLAVEAEDAVAQGFDCKVAIHPSQVATIRSSFSPGMEQVEWARRLLAAAEDQQAAVFLFEGRMVDGPVFAQARRILRLAAQ